MLKQDHHCILHVFYCQHGDARTRRAHNVAPVEYSFHDHRPLRAVQTHDRVRPDQLQLNQVILEEHDQDLMMLDAEAEEDHVENIGTEGVSSMGKTGRSKSNRSTRILSLFSQNLSGLVVV